MARAQVSRELVADPGFQQVGGDIRECYSRFWMPFMRAPRRSLPISSGAVSTMEADQARALALI